MTVVPQPRRRTLLLAAPALALTSIAPAAAAARPVPPFSAAPPGASAVPGWQHRPLPKVPRDNAFAIAQDAGRRVLHVRSAGSASTFVARIDAPLPARPVLQWEWRVSRALDGSDLRTKQGDDYAARLYVLFDLPLERLAFGDRLALQAARALAGTELPAAAICYVWGTAQPAGTSGWNAYTDRVRMVVADSGDAQAGRWRTVRRDLRADWEAAGFGGPLPPVAAIAVSADTDNTGEAVEAWFSDVVLGEAG